MIRVPSTAEWAASIRIAAVTAGLAVTVTPAAAQTPRPPARPAAPSTPVPATPQQTTASFADWTLRCTLTAGSATKFCEVVQNIQQNDRPVAQIAIGRPVAGQKLQLTVLVPPNVSLQAGPGLLAGSEGESAPVLALAWRRCLPIGCIADAALGSDVVNRLRGWTEPGRITFTDGAGRAAGLPFSPRGLAQAMDALTKEEGAG